MSAEHINYGASRTTQINPYWVSQDGKFRFDFSLIQSIEARNAANSVYTATDRRSDEYRTTNYGLGSGTMKLTWKPTEDLTIVGAMAHLYSNAKNGEIYYKRNQNAALAAPGSSYAYVDEDANPVAVAWDRNGTARWDDRVNSSSNTALHLGFTYNPAAFCKKLTVWGQGTYEMNTAFIDDQDYLGINAGVKYDFTDKFSAFVMGDFMRGDAGTDTVRGWRGQIGGIYTVGNGLWVESGWSHESITTKHAAGDAHAKAKGDTLYTRVVFDF
jgi:hypothetical protein